MDRRCMLRICGSRTIGRPRKESTPSWRPKNRTGRAAAEKKTCWLVVYKVVPQFGIANLVQISPISLGLMGVISIVFMGIVNQLITRGYHLVTCKIGNTKKTQVTSPCRFLGSTPPKHVSLRMSPPSFAVSIPICAAKNYRYILGTTIPRSLFIPFKTLQPPNKHLNIMNAILYIAINVRTCHLSFINQEYTTV